MRSFSLPSSLIGWVVSPTGNYSMIVSACTESLPAP